VHDQINLLKEKANLKKYIIILIILSPLAFSSSYAQQENNYRLRGTNPRYEIDDWVSYSTTRWIYSLAQGLEYVYFATSGGILRFNYYTKKWDFPWTMSNGLADNNILVVAYDEDTNYLWCASTVAVSCYRSTSRQWENYFYDEIGLPLQDEIVSIGIDQDNVWIESYSGRLFKSFKQGCFFQYENMNNNRFSNDIRWFGYRANIVSGLPKFFMSGGYFF